jgi:hypothetical protein
VIGTAANDRAKVQTLVDAYAAVLALAEVTPPATVSNLSSAQFAALGINGVGAYNLDLVNAAIASVTATDVDTVAKLQALINPLADFVVPTLLGSTPMDNGVAVGATKDLTFTFSENIFKGSGNIVLKNLTDNTNVVIAIGSSEVTIANNVLTLNPVANLLTSKNYAVQIEAGAITDVASNAYAGINNNTQLNFTTETYTPGQAVISLGAVGQLIAPVRVEGNWYYVWDRNVDGRINADFVGGVRDQADMNVIENLFYGKSAGQVINADNRTASVNGVTLKLPTMGKLTPTFTDGEVVTGTAVNSPEQINNTYDDLLAIWDAFNGDGTGISTSGVPPGWISSEYWSASLGTFWSGSHAGVQFGNGTISDTPSNGQPRYIAFQVVDTSALTTAPSSITLTPSGGTVVANTLNSTNTALAFAASIVAGQATGGRADFYVGGVLIGTDDTIATGSTSVNYSSSDGSPTSIELQAAIAAGGLVTVKLFDAAGRSLMGSGPTLVRDIWAPTAPTGITSTAVGGTVVANTINNTNTAVTFLATIGAGQATGGRAEFYVGSDLLGTDSTIGAGDNSVSYTTPTTTNLEIRDAIALGGVVSVKLFDAAGNSVTGTGPTLTRDITSGSPTVTSIGITSATGLENSTLSAGDVVTVTLAMSDVVTVTNSPQLSLNIGGTTVQATYDSALSTSTNLRFSYKILVGQSDGNGISLDANALVLNGGTIKDSNGNDVLINTDAVTDNAGYLVNNSTIDLGSFGRLILPVQIESKWYYFWDRSGDGLAGGTGGTLNGGVDTANHNVLDGIFKFDVNGNGNPGSDTTDTFRFATLNGVQLALPTAGATKPPPGETLQNTAYSAGSTTAFARDAVAQSNLVYDDLAAIWDGHYSPSISLMFDNSGAPAGDLSAGTGWVAGTYWSSTAALNPGQHQQINLITGSLIDRVDANASWVALQVL